MRNVKVVKRMAAEIVFILSVLTILLQGCNVNAFEAEPIVPSARTYTNNIMIDGDAADWAEIPTLATATAQSAQSLKIAHNETYLYICIEGSGMGPYYDLLINTDDNSATGYQAWMWTTSGCDYLIENGTLYVSTDTGWQWSSLGTNGLTISGNSNVAEFSIARSVLADPSGPLNFGFWDVNSIWEITSMLPDSGALPAYALTEQPTPTPAPEPPSPAPLKVMVPAYFYPGTQWSRLATQAAAMPGRLYAIANPLNGPGSAADSNYQSAINNLRNNGGKVLGYVYTQYGTRNLKKVKKDIDSWYAWYAIDGIFLDEQASTPGKENYYQSLYTDIKAIDSDALIVGNPGTSAPESYLYYNGSRVTDVLCIFEAPNGFLSWSPPVWTLTWQNSNFFALPYNTSAAGYTLAVDHALNRNIGWIYVTDDVLPNPWDTLPSYFEDFCDYIIN